VFPSLEVLHIKGYAPFVTRILQVATATRLRVFSLSTDNSKLAHVSRCLEELSSRFGKHLRDVSVVTVASGISSSERSPSDLAELANGTNDGDGGRPVSMMDTVLKPLLRIQDLEDFSLHFVHPRAFLNDASICQMASAWRKLKLLSIITGRSPLHGLQCLADLANLCPSLAELRIDANGLIPPPLELWESPPHDLRTLWIRNFQLQGASNYPAALKYIDHLFPNLRSGNICERKVWGSRWEVVYTLEQAYHPAKKWSSPSTVTVRDAIDACRGSVRTPSRGRETMNSISKV
jgi:hypothetical protein